MKIAKSQLQRIIREERLRLLYEQPAEHPYDTAKWQDAEVTTSENDAVDAILSDLINSGADQRLIDEVEEAINYNEDMEYILSLIPDRVKDILGQAIGGEATGGLADFVADAAAPPMSDAARAWNGQNANESLEDSLKTLAKAFQEDYKNNHHPYIQLMYRMALDGRVEELKQKAVDDLRVAVKNIKPTKKETQKDRDDGIYRGYNMVQDLEAMADAPGSYSLSRWIFSLRARPKKVLDLLPLTESRGNTMKITKRQLRRIIKEAVAKPKRPLNESHPYDQAASDWYDRSESNTDVADQISIDLFDELGPDHPLALRIEQMIDDENDDFEDLLDEIQWASEDGSAPADLKDRLYARDSM